MDNRGSMTTISTQQRNAYGQKLLDDVDTLRNLAAAGDTHTLGMAVGQIASTADAYSFRDVASAARRLNKSLHGDCPVTIQADLDTLLTTIRESYP